MIHAYRQPTYDEQLVIAADPADGGSDYCAAVVKSRKYFDTVMVYHDHSDSAQFGHELYRMAKFMQKCTNMFPMMGVERNTGMATIYVLQQLNYPRLFRMPNNIGVVDKEEEKKIGWVTNMATRAKMLDDLALSLKQHINIIPHEETILEMMSFIKNPRTGKPEAAPGKHDDLVMAEAIAWQMVQFAPTATPSDWTRITQQFPDDGVPEYGR